MNEKEEQEKNHYLHNVSQNHPKHKPHDIPVKHMLIIVHAFQWYTSEHVGTYYYGFVKCCPGTLNIRYMYVSIATVPCST